MHSSVTGIIDRLSAPPRWVTLGPGGIGFNEVAAALLHD
jgi:hypothetical protein